ncbi:MAG: hypothetical protein R6V53_05810 [Candidatus Woesearchaeota archaeon]
MSIDKKLDELKSINGEGLPQKSSKRETFNSAWHTLHKNTKRFPVVVDKQKSVQEFTQGLDDLCNKYERIQKNSKFPYKLIRRKNGVSEAEIVEEIESKFYTGYQLISALVADNENTAKTIQSKYSEIKASIEDYAKKIDERYERIKESEALFKELKELMEQYADDGIPEDMDALQKHHKYEKEFMNQERKLANDVYEAKIYVGMLKKKRDHATELELLSRINNQRSSDLKEFAGEMKTTIDYHQDVRPAMEKITLDSEIIKDMYGGLTRFKRMNNSIQSGQIDKANSAMKIYNEQKQQNESEEKNLMSKLEQLEQNLYNSKPEFSSKDHDPI